MIPPAVPAAPKKAPVPWKQPGTLIGAGVGLVLLVGIGLLFANSRRKARLAMLEMQKQLEAAKTTAPSQVEGESKVAEKEPVAVAAANDGFTKQMAEIRESFKLPPMLTTKTEVLTKQLLEEARKDPSAMAQIVRSWLNESK
jgi:flagellar biosynthesis/type III secretory pathway M-ring protein FliF/YscJ